MEKGLATILVIDDEKDILRGLKDMLEAEKFRALTALTGKKGLDIAREEKPNLIVLDLRLPDMDGYDVCRQLRQENATKKIPIIMLSTRGKDTEKIIGLEIGADDYVAKPYNPLELLARIRASLRRSQLNQGSPTEDTASAIDAGDLQVNLETRSVKIKKQAVKLTRKEFDLLVLLVSKPGRVYSRSSILSSIWGESYESLQGTIDVHVKTLRNKLGSLGKMIETVPTIGYRWAEPDDK